MECRGTYVTRAIQYHLRAIARPSWKVGAVRPKMVCCSNNGILPALHWTPALLGTLGPALEYSIIAGLNPAKRFHRGTIQPALQGDHQRKFYCNLVACFRPMTDGDVHFHQKSVSNNKNGNLRPGKTFVQAPRGLERMCFFKSRPPGRPAPFLTQAGIHGDQPSTLQFPL